MDNKDMRRDSRRSLNESILKNLKEAKAAKEAGSYIDVDRPEANDPMIQKGTIEFVTRILKHINKMLGKKPEVLLNSNGSLHFEFDNGKVVKVSQSWLRKHTEGYVEDNPDYLVAEYVRDNFREYSPESARFMGVDSKKESTKVPAADNTLAKVITIDFWNGDDSRSDSSQDNVTKDLDKRGLNYDFDYDQRNEDIIRMKVEVMSNQLDTGDKFVNAWKDKIDLKVKKIKQV